jgi:hypothetical protein
MYRAVYGPRRIHGYRCGRVAVWVRRRVREAQGRVIREGVSVRPRAPPLAFRFPAPVQASFTLAIDARSMSVVAYFLFASMHAIPQIALMATRFPADLP